MADAHDAARWAWRCYARRKEDNVRVGFAGCCLAFIGEPSECACRREERSCQETSPEESRMLGEGCPNDLDSSAQGEPDPYMFREDPE